MKKSRLFLLALGLLAGSAVQAGPITVLATTGCASSSFCTLQELYDGGSLSAGGLTFDSFTEDFQYGWDQWDANAVQVKATAAGNLVTLRYDFATTAMPSAQVPTLLKAIGGAALDVAFNVRGHLLDNQQFRGIAGARASNLSMNTGTAWHRGDLWLQLFDGFTRRYDDGGTLEIENGTTLFAQPGAQANFAPSFSLTGLMSLSHALQGGSGESRMLYVESTYNVATGVPVPASLLLMLPGLILLARRRQ